MKTILIPSDFSEESLDFAEKVIRKEEGALEIIFIHMFRVPSGIQDILFSTYRKKEEQYVSPEFRSRCTELKNMFSYKLKKCTVRFFYGNTLSMLKNYLEVHRVTHIACTDNIRIRKLCKSSLPLESILEKCLPQYEEIRLAH